ncbi:hypothetical protein A11Q_2540 [Pseudobdellovibrio exovorus JSS]|uniref:Uncharacterized protein n=1 Tax=Pseudobdellovibrio exovorus JSS TaxID=1184267 RepID=M4VFC7_9BACT|nr:hypothetical protein A11Q_2540 [Pseudobdellovibrio exovorus JSS]
MKSFFAKRVLKNKLWFSLPFIAFVAFLFFFIKTLPLSPASNISSILVTADIYIEMTPSFLQGSEILSPRYTHLKFSATKKFLQSLKEGHCDSTPSLCEKFNYITYKVIAVDKNQKVVAARNIKTSATPAPLSSQSAYNLNTNDLNASFTVIFPASSNIDQIQLFHEDILISTTHIF